MITDQQKAFEQLYHDNVDKVHRLCLGYVKGNQPLATDLQQEVFMKVWQHWNSFKGTAKRSTWLYRIAVNTCLQFLRDNKNKLTESLDNKIEQVVETVVDKELQYATLYACMNKLNKVNKSILLLELEEVPQQEIAAIVGINHNAVRTRINRIKQQLTKCVNHENI